MSEKGAPERSNGGGAGGVNPWHALLLRPVPRGDGIAADKMLVGVEPEFVERLTEHGRPHKLERHEVLYRQGEPATDLFLVGRGAVVLTVASTSGPRAPIAVLGQSALFGSAALLGEGQKREATATAAVETLVSSFPATAVLSLLDEYPTAGAAVRSALVRQVLELSERVVESLHMPAPQRIRRRLAALAVAHPDGIVPITQQELAGLAGTSRATVNTALAAEVRAGTVVIRRSTIEVLDVDRLLDFVPDLVTPAPDLTT